MDHCSDQCLHTKLYKHTIDLIRAISKVSRKYHFYLTEAALLQTFHLQIVVFSGIVLFTLKKEQPSTKHCNPWQRNASGGKVAAAWQWRVAHAKRGQLVLEKFMTLVGVLQCYCFVEWSTTGD